MNLRTDLYTMTLTQVYGELHEFGTKTILNTRNPCVAGPRMCTFSPFSWDVVSKDFPMNKYWEIDKMKRNARIYVEA